MATSKKTPAAKTKRKSAPKVAPMRSFRLSRDTPPFFSFRFTHQTFYWTVLCVLILALGVWVVMLNVRVQNLYNKIDATNNEVQLKDTGKDY
jgi:hypothetical protein